MKKLLLVFLACSAVFGQVAAEANRDYQSPEAREKIMSGLQSGSRDTRQRPKELIAALGIRPGMTVADVGSGGGYGVASRIHSVVVLWAPSRNPFVGPSSVRLTVSLPSATASDTVVTAKVLTVSPA